MWRNRRGARRSWEEFESKPPAAPFYPVTLAASLAVEENERDSLVMDAVAVRYGALQGFAFSWHGLDGEQTLAVARPLRSSSQLFAVRLPSGSGGSVTLRREQASFRAGYPGRHVVPTPGPDILFYHPATSLPCESFIGAVFALHA